MSARSRALIPLSAEQQAAMQAVAVTEQRRRQGRTLSAWPYATAFFLRIFMKGDHSITSIEIG
ncbi:plasmid SOS inhibition protein A [Escherichia coli]